MRVRGVATPVPCGQCMLCRINKRRVWTTRLLLEFAAYGSRASFLTLTYSDPCLPLVASGCSTLFPPDVVLGLKRLRRAVAPVRLRYYVVGEYGDRTWRPHYHLLLFGVGPSGLPVGRCVRGRDYEFEWWPFGSVNVGHTVSQEVITYVAQYVTKKLTSVRDERLATGQYPEFARMSRMGGGGIGSQAFPSLVAIARRYGFVPRSVKLDGKFWPLGRYVIHRVSELSGVPVSTKAEEVMFRGSMRHLQTLAEIRGTSAEEVLSEAGRESEKKILARPSYNSRSL